MKRLIEEELDRWYKIDSRKPLLLQGTRQVGKTYSLKAFGARHFRSCHYINFEERESFIPAFSGDLNPDRIVLADKILQAFRQKRRLAPIHFLDKALHQKPRYSNQRDSSTTPFLHMA